MNLALCHAIPRDGLVLLALLFILASVVLEAVAIGHVKSKNAAGEFRDNGQASSVLGFIAAHPSLYSSDLSTKLCDSRSEFLSFHCARFAEAHHTMNGLILASFISAVVMWVVGFCVIGRYSSTTLKMLFAIIVVVSLPTALQCAVVGIFFVRVVGNGREDVKRLTGVSKVTFHRHFGANLMIAATALMGAALVVVVVRYFVTCCAVKQLKRKSNPSKADAERMMKLHLVNDDWMRQKQVLRSHAKSVQVEMQIRKEDETFLEPGAHQHHHTRDPAIRFVRRSANSSFAIPPAQDGVSAVTEVPFSDVEVQEPRNKRQRRAAPEAAPAPTTEKQRDAFEPLDESEVEL